MPLVAVEILSPRQGPQDVLDNIEVYLANGVKGCWFVSPELHTVQILTADGGEAVHHDGIVTDPVTGVAVDLDAVFS